MELTATMWRALNHAVCNGGILERRPGGFWMLPSADYLKATSFGTPTVEALVKRGRMEYSEWKDGKRGKFPIRAQVVTSPSGGR